ncbi:MAG TPA: hypothetical protein VIS49_09980 [Cyclobacteriaceae bacterium]
MKKIFLSISLSLMVIFAYGQTSQTGTFGIRAGIGTDISLGISYGAGFNYCLQENMELGLVLFGGKFSETSNNGFNYYEETTNIFAIAAQANWLFNHRPDETKPFFIAGTGLASISYDWEERSATDTSLGTPLPGGGSMQSEEGSTGGIIFNIGAGMTFASPFDLRFEVPIMVPFGVENVGVVPLFMLTAGYRL